MYKHRFLSGMFKTFPLYVFLIVLLNPGLLPGAKSKPSALEKYFADYILPHLPPRNSELYTVPSDQDKKIFIGAVSNLLRGTQKGFSAAEIQLSRLQYMVKQLPGAISPAPVIIIQEKQPARGQYFKKGWGVVLINPQKPNGPIIEISYPLNHVGTGLIGVQAFESANASLLFMAGAHRFSSSIIRNGHRLSDAAQQENSLFAILHENLLLSQVTMIQIQGWNRNEGAAYQRRIPPVVLSTGLNKLNMKTGERKYLRDWGEQLVHQVNTLDTDFLSTAGFPDENLIEFTGSGGKFNTKLYASENFLANYTYSQIQVKNPHFFILFLDRALRTEENGARLVRKFLFEKLGETALNFAAAKIEVVPMTPAVEIAAEDTLDASKEAEIEQRSNVIWLLITNFRLWLIGCLVMLTALIFATVLLMRYKWTVRENEKRIYQKDIIREKIDGELRKEQLEVKKLSRSLQEEIEKNTLIQEQIGELKSEKKVIMDSYYNISTENAELKEQASRSSFRGLFDEEGEDGKNTYEADQSNPSGEAKQSQHALQKLQNEIRQHKVVHLLTHPDTGMILTGTLMVGLLRIQLAGQVLIKLLFHENNRLRIGAIWALGELRSKENTGYLVRLLEEPNRQIARATANALQKIGYRPELVAKDSEIWENIPPIKQDNLDIFTSGGSPTPEAFLFNSLLELDADIQILGIQSLRRIQTTESIQYLIEFLDSQTMEVRREALVQLSGVLSNLDLEDPESAALHHKAIQKISAIYHSDDKELQSIITASLSHYFS